MFINTNAQNIVDGTLGVDLKAMGSSSESRNNSYKKIDGIRFLSNHFIKLSNNGFVINDDFANYSLASTIKGSFTSTNTDDIEKSTFISTLCTF